MYHYKKHPNSHQAGYTLVELLVGAFIGLFLVAGMAQMYVSGKQTFNVSQSVGRAQEDLRFAYHFITRDLRETSFTGCLRNVRNMIPAANRNNLNDLTIKIGGWDYDDTSPGDPDVTLDTNYAVSTQLGNWNGLDVDGSTDLPNFINSVANSDVLMVRAITPLDGAIVTAAGGTPNQTLGVNSPNAALAVDDVLVVGNCRVADQFIVGSVNAGANVESIANSFREDWGAGSRMFDISNTYYYIGLRNGADTPSLFRVSVTPNGPQSAAQELVEGVESMQILYGINTDANTADANRYVSARDVNDWTQVVSTRIGLILVQPDGRTPSVANVETVSYGVIDDLNFVSSLGDTSLRFTSISTIKTRNLGTAPDFVLRVCNTDDPNGSRAAACNANGFATF